MFFNAGTITRTAARQMAPRVEAAGNYLAAKMKEVVGVQGVPQSRRSLPGEPPRMESTTLNKSIQSLYGEFPDMIVASAGSGVPYGRTLEVEMNRPWCLATLKNKTAEVRQILGIQ